MPLVGYPSLTLPGSRDLLVCVVFAVPFVANHPTRKECRRTSTVDSYWVGELRFALCDKWFDRSFVFFRNADQLHTLCLILVNVELVEMWNRDFARRTPGCPELDHCHFASADFERITLHVL